MAQGTLEKVQAIIAEIKSIDIETIHPSSSFESLGIDSIDMLEIIMRLEDTFGIEISDDDASSITTVAQAVEYIDNKK